MVTRKDGRSEEVVQGEPEEADNHKVPKNETRQNWVLPVRNSSVNTQQPNSLFTESLIEVDNGYKQRCSHQHWMREHKAKLQCRARKASCPRSTMAETAQVYVAAGVPPEPETLSNQYVYIYIQIHMNCWVLPFLCN